MKKLCFLLVLASLIGCTSTPQTNKQGQKQADSPKNELPKINKDKGEYGIWKVTYYVDDFGEPTKDGYVFTSCTGKFSNSATTNSELGVKFIIDESVFCIQLYEYNRNHPVKGYLDTFQFKAKRSDGEILEFETLNDEYGHNFVHTKYDKKIRAFLQQGKGEVKFIAECRESNLLSQYEFTLKDISYLSEALAAIKVSESNN